MIAAANAKTSPDCSRDVFFSKFLTRARCFSLRCTLRCDAHSSAMSMMDSMKRRTVEDEVNHLDGKGAVTAATLFKQLDATGDGKLDEAEFGQIYEVLKGHITQEHNREREQQAKITGAKKRMKAMGALILMLLGFLCLSIAGNFATTLSVVQANKDMYVKEGFEVDKSGKSVGVASSVSLIGLLDLLKDENRPFVKTMESVTLREGKPNEAAFALTGYNYTSPGGSPLLELYGATKKVCITESFHVQTELNEPCPATVFVARQLSTFDEEHYEVERNRMLSGGGACAPCTDDTCLGACVRCGTFGTSEICRNNWIVSRDEVSRHRATEAY